MKGQFEKGHPPWNKGLKQPQKEAHHFWKGDDAPRSALRHWFKKYWGKATKCENPDCHYPRYNRANKLVTEPKRFEWAHRAGKPYDRNPENYVQLCRSCYATLKYEVSF